QKEAAERLGIAEATLSRWLTDTQIQSRALDNWLRAFFAFPNVREAFPGEGQTPRVGVSEEPQYCPQLEVRIQDRDSGHVNRINLRYSSREDQVACAAAGNGLHLFSRN